MRLIKPSIIFDTNCLIDLETKRLGYETTQKIVDLWREDKINLSVTAISASEKTLSGEKITNYSQFQDFIDSIGLKGVETLKPIGYWDVTFMEWCLHSGEKLKEIELKIHQILFQNISYKCDKDNYRKWLNAKIDVLVAWCFVWNKKDILVTRDNNFKKLKLHNIYFGEIMTPEEFISYFCV